MKYRINNDPGTPVPEVLWLVSYNPETGLVTSASEDVGEAMEFDTEEERDAAIELINSNPNNTFIGHVPKPHH